MDIEGPQEDVPGGGTLLEQEVEATPRTSTGDGDHERFAHYVRKDKVVESAVLGAPLTALCGKVWVPSRDPQRFPVCPTCKEIHERMGAGGSGDAGSD